MSKFNSILENYLAVNETIDPKEIGTEISKLTPQQLAPLQAAVDGQNPTDNKNKLAVDFIHQILQDPTKLAKDHNPNDETVKALESGFGLTIHNPESDNTQQTKEADSQKKSPTDSSSSTAYGIGSKQQGGETPESSIQGI